MSSLDAPLPDAFYYCAAPLCKRPPLPSHQLQWWGGSHNCPAGWYCLPRLRSSICFDRCIEDELSNHWKFPPKPEQISHGKAPYSAKKSHVVANDEYAP